MIAEEHIKTLVEAIDSLFRSYPNWKERAAADRKALVARNEALEFLKNQEAVERILQKID